MPSAGAVAPPVIRPLRTPTPGRSAVHIDSATYLEIFTETPNCKIYFTTDGTRPDAFQNRSGKESTFRYRAPFSLNPGRRLLKTIAVSRDGLRQSDVVSRSFVVDNANHQPPPAYQLPPTAPMSTDEEIYSAEVTSDVDDVVDFRNPNHNKVVRYKKVKRSPPRREVVEEIFETEYGSEEDCGTVTDTARTEKTVYTVRRRGSGSLPRSRSRPDLPRSTSAAEITTVYNGRPGTASTVCTARAIPGPNSSVIVDGNCVSIPTPCPAPAGPLMSTVRSSPQLACAWGIPPAVPVTRLGYMTDKMLHRLEESRDFTVAEMRRTIEETRRGHSPPPPPMALMPPPQPEPPQEPPVPVVREPPLHAVSPGNGLWREQVEHIYAHLLQYAKDHVGFRVAIAEPRMGDISGLEFEETETTYVLRLEVTRFDQPVTPAVREKKIMPQRHEKKTPPSGGQRHAVINHPPKREEPVRDPPRPPPQRKEEKPVKKPDPPRPKDDVESYLRTEEDQDSQGTIKPLPYFNVERDCEILRKAMKGLGTDEQALIDVLGARSANQRVEISKQFKFMYGKDLIANLESETSGNFRECLVALAKSPAEYDASEIRRAVKGAGTDEDCLIEIICTRTNAQLAMVKQTYKKLFNRDAEKDVADDTSGDFKHILISLLQGNRNESKEYDLGKAKQDAKELYNAGEGKKWGTEESVFTKILCTRSFPHLRAVFEAYRDVSKKDIEDALKSEMSGDLLRSCLTIVRCIRNKHGYFALALYKSMKGLGTDDKALVRISVTRCEIDMVQIKREFKTKYNQRLEDFIKDDTSGDYRKLLLKLVGGNADACAASEAAGPTTVEPGEIKTEEVKENTERPAEEIAFFQTEPELDQTGTLKPYPDFDASKDSEVLRKAMKGLGTDEKSIINVMGYRSVTQRLDIVKTFKSMFGKDLEKELVSETSGNFKKILVALCKSPEEYDCLELRRAVKGAGTDEEALIEIICTRSNKQLEIIKTKYKEVFPGRDLEKDIVDDTSGDFKHVLVSLLQACRPETREYDVNRVKADAEALVKAGETWKTEKSKFVEILCSRSQSHLRAMFVEFEKIKGKDFEEYLKKEMSGDILKSLLTLTRCIRNKAGYFAIALQRAMKGAGTNDDSLVRVVVTRCEIDMVQIKEEFERQFKGSLADWIKDDTSGDYRRTLMALIGEPMSK